jgi:hypothetical protein
MKKITLTLTLLLTLLVSNSCTDAFLDTKPTDRLSDDSFWKTEGDARAGVNAIYQIMSRGNNARSGWIDWMPVATNDVLYVDSNPLNDLIQRFIWTADNPRFHAVWTGAYQGITAANTVINRVSKMAIADDVKKPLIAQAKFLRAVYYWVLQGGYGDVPLVVEEQNATSEINVPRTPRAQVLEQIAKDLTEAAADLPVKWDNANLGRATRGAALAFLVKTHLYQEDWTKAAARAREMIDLGVYDLEPNYRDLFKLSNENNRESVFEMQYRDVLTGWGDSRPGHYLTQNAAPRGAGNEYSPYGGWGNYIPPANLPQAFEANDERRPATFIMAGETFKPELGGATFTMTPTITRTGMAFTKWWLGVPANNNDHSPLNLPIVRFSSVLLDYAEALNELGQTGEAYRQINRVRQRAKLPLKTAGSKDQALDDIFRERRVEFIWEFFQWYDLTRRNRHVNHIKMFHPTNESAQNIKDFHRLFPIPQNELDANKAMTQNQGYN